MINTKNITLLLGVVFGVSIYFCVLYAIPCCLLLLVNFVYSLEMTAKKKRMIEEHLNFKLKSYEEERDILRKEFDKIKLDFDNFKSKISVTQMYGKS